MLTEAQIEIVDEAGHVEDRVRIVGTGEIVLATKDRAWFQLTSEDPADVDAIIALRGGSVIVEARKPRALRVDDASCRWRSRAASPRVLVALIAAVKRTLRVRTVELPTASLMTPGGAVIREESSELVRQASTAAARGLVKVQEHLAACAHEERSTSREGSWCPLQRT